MTMGLAGRAGNQYISVKFGGVDFTKALKFVKAMPVPEREWNPMLGVWKVKLSRENFTALAAFGFVPNDELKCWHAGERFIPPEVPQDVPKAVVTLNTSIAIPDDPELPGFRPYQVAGVHFVESRGGIALIADEMGLGKTWQALGYLRKHPERYPAVIVSTASTKLNWEREAQKLVPKARIQVLSGLYKPGDRLFPADIYICNYDILGREDPVGVAEENAREAAHEAKMKAAKTAAALSGMAFRPTKFKRKTIPLVGWCVELAKKSIKCVIVDECQYLADPSTLRSRSVVQLARSAPMARILMSGTPMNSAVAQFWTTLNLLDPAAFPNEWGFKMRYCDPVKGRYGWEFRGLTKSKADELHQMISKFMIRRRKADVLTDLPPKTKSMIPMELDLPAMAKYEQMSREFDEWLKRHDTVGTETQIKFQQMREQAYLAKRTAMLRWITDFLYVTPKLIVFAYHHMVLDDIQRAFPKISVRIDGGTNPNDRLKIIDRFQNDSRVELFIGQTVAAGVGITLTAASNVMVAEMIGTPSQLAQAEDRAHRIGQRDAVNIWYPYAPGSVDEDAIALVESTNGQLSAVLDGSSETFFNTDINHLLIQRRMKKVRQ